jgi:hypothetical protein
MWAPDRPSSTPLNGRSVALQIVPLSEDEHGSGEDQNRPQDQRTQAPARNGHGELLDDPLVLRSLTLRLAVNETEGPEIMIRGRLADSSRGLIMNTTRNRTPQRVTTTPPQMRFDPRSLMVIASAAFRSSHFGASRAPYPGNATHWPLRGADHVEQFGSVGHNYDGLGEVGGDRRPHAFVGDAGSAPDWEDRELGRPCYFDEQVPDRLPA